MIETESIPQRNARPEPSKAAVNDYLDCVYSAALRQVGDPHLAADITQTVFLIFHKKQAHFNARTPLLAWLLRTTRYTCLAALRRERHRKFHERKAASMRDEAHLDDSQDLMGVIDAAIDDLGNADRVAIVAIYFEGLSAAEYARRAAISEQAAYKRVQRALEKLKMAIKKRGNAAGEHGINERLLSLAVPTVAPASLAASISRFMPGMYRRVFSRWSKELP
jgi:RNA polymerase sigma factor (sigma-70 family)